MPTYLDPLAPPADELALIVRVARRDRAAFAALYRLYHGRLSRFLSRFTTRHDLVDEAINDTLWIVWCKAAEFRGDSQVSTWIMGIACRVAFKALRRDDPAHEPLADGSPEAAAPDHAQEHEQHEWLLRGLRHLPLDQQMTLQLAYYLGHSGEEIAAIMECPVSTVKARMFHARVKLRNLLPAIADSPPRRSGGTHD